MSCQMLRPSWARATVFVRLSPIAVLLCTTSSAFAAEQPASTNLPPVVVEQGNTPPPAPQVTTKKSAAPNTEPAAHKTVRKKTYASPKPQSPTPSASDTIPESGDIAPIASRPQMHSVGSTGLAVPANTSTMTQQSIAPDATATSNTAVLLGRVPGYSVYQAGGVSGLPVLNGLADERVKVIVGGVETTPACANHMNPPLSYIAPGTIGAVEVTSGVTSVSKGGDSLGGTVIVDRPQARYASPDEPVRAWGSVSSFYRSNGDGFGGSVIAEAATSKFSLRYDGSFANSGDYDRGGDGGFVRSTEYEAWNHGVTLTARSQEDSLILHGATQRIPYQGFPNQRMDMGDTSGDILGNKAYEADVRYTRHTSFGLVEASGFYNHVQHYMNFLKDKGGSTPATGMPMYTDSVEFGYGLKVEMPLSDTGVVRFGNEFHAQDYDEWWAPTCSGGMMCMMGPLTFWNVNGGSRDRLGSFVEWENKWTRTWTTLLGMRNDVVWMDTGNVQPYDWMGMMNMADATAATDFNARDHARTDVNFDVTAMVRYAPVAASSFELAYGRKTRSPNLYERYAWAKGTMAMNMVGWFGDVNGYTGNLDLSPEIANTVSFTAAWHDPERAAWGFKVTPYYTYVQDFIDVDTIGTITSGTSKFARLRLANHDAQLAGVNVSGETEIWDSSQFGLFGLTATVGYVYGERRDGGDLYHIMPINARLGLTHTLGRWSNLVEVQLVGDKDRVDERRYEPVTAGYALVNLHTSYEWQNVRFDLGVRNLFDKLYYDPLGGRDFVDWKAIGGTIGPVPGIGRSLNAGITVKF